jgi:hypothetical protein
VGDDATMMLFAVHGMRRNGSDTANVWLPELLHRMSTGRSLIDFGAWDAAAGPVELDPEITPHEHLLRRLTEPRGTMGADPGQRRRRRGGWHLGRRAPAGALNGLETSMRRLAGGRSQPWWEMNVRPPAEPAPRPPAPGVLVCDYPVPAWYCEYWPGMRYFVLPSFSDVHLRVNLRGRERDGIVAPEDYERVLDEMDALLESLVDARTGKRVVSATFRVRSDDPMRPGGPTADLVAVVDQVADAVRHPDLGVIGPTPIFRSGEHSTNGWVAMRTPGRRAGDVETARPRDVGATILHHLGRRPSPLVTGRSLSPALAVAAR